jgi:hypothetical protein
MNGTSEPFKMTILALLHVVCLIWSSQSGAQDVKSAGPSKRPLQGGIALDEVLPGLPEKYKEGSPLDKADLQRLTPENNWFPIPDWFAGKWSGKERVIEYVESFKTGAKKTVHRRVKQPCESFHGHQQDKSGQIWEYIEIPRWKQPDSRLNRVYLRLLRQDVLESNSKQVMLQDLHNQIVVGRDDKQIILSSFQVQQLSTYTADEEGLLTLRASLKRFDSDGTPILMERCSMLLTKIGPYREVDSLDGLDLKKLFAEYLKKIGRSELLPEPK